MTRDNSLWVEPVGNLIIARVRGIPTEELLRDCQERVVALARETGYQRALYDALEMDAPVVDVALSQRKLDEAAGPMKLRRAIVVPNTKLAYLARLAFGEGDYRVFYNDITAAVQWLSEDGV
jgi:hypothetical protein